MHIPKSIAIRSSYSHHSANAGYKQILKYTKPSAIIGLDENGSANSKFLRNKYMWLYEWDAYQIYKQNKVDILHILYAEEYYRFAWRMFKCPIVATFHQPPNLLQTEITTGANMGRVGAITHQLNKQRFGKLAAAIVTTQSQKDVLQQVINPQKIHVIPLGVDIQSISKFYETTSNALNNYQIITVGNWKRDWNFYFSFVEYCLHKHPNYKFILINRKFTNEQLLQIKNLPNIVYLPNASDAEMYTLYKNSYLQFLPFEGAAGNNSLNEGIALGCPVVSNVVPEFLENVNEYLFYTPLINESVANILQAVFEMSLQQRITIATIARNAALKLDWAETARKTIEIYNSVV